MDSSNQKDPNPLNVSWDSTYYAKYRPNYSSNVFDAIFKFINLDTKDLPSSKQGVAVDVGCGSGQVTLVLPRYFDTVIGIDPSESQLQAARQRAAKSDADSSNVTFLCAPSENTNLPSSSVDLITAGSSLHWFDIKPFYRECRRILKQSGGFAAWSYYKQPAFHVNGKESKQAQDIYVEVQAIFKSYFNEKLSSLLPTNDSKEDDARRNQLLLPVQGVDFEHVETMAVEMIWPASVDITSGWVRSWSGYLPYIERHGQEKADELILGLEENMMRALGISTRDCAVDIVMVIDIILAKQPIPIV